MNTSKSQANNMGLLSTRIIELMLYATILTVIIIIPKGLYAQTGKYWVYFKSKNNDQKVDISAKAQNRRETRGSLVNASGYDQMPDNANIQALKDAGLTVHTVSRWLNAASVSGELENLAAIENANFVENIHPVAHYSGRRFDYEELSPEMAKAFSPTQATALDYGISYNQLHLCQIDSLHSLGYSGEGVLIGILDTGFRLDQSCLTHIIDDNRLIATYDFINDDENVQDETSSQQSHGTSVWSVIGAYDEGSMIGAAYNAEFILAKTEIVNEEIETEEDYWVAAIEWMEPQGVDIVSSSLGYTDWYEQSDMDGNTAAITIAADIAAELGVVVVNSAGNERGNSWDLIMAPADGDSVIAAGGVTSDGTLWSGSSPGPTADGRIKPDVCAMSSQVIAANYLSDGFGAYTGTSFSAPIISGGLALILEAYPDWNVNQIISKLKHSATQTSNPDNDYGWGIARFYNMYNGEDSAQYGEGFYIAPNPAYNSVVFRFNPPLEDPGTITVFTVAGDEIVNLNLQPSAEGLESQTWAGTNSNGNKIASGIYIAMLHGQAGHSKIKFAFVNN